MKEFNPADLFPPAHIKALADLAIYIEDILTENKSLKEQLKEYKKDNDIQDLQEKVDQLTRNSLYMMSDQEKQAETQFKKTHTTSCKGDIIYRLKGTGFGLVIELGCAKCGVTEDITDTSWW